MTCTKLFIYIHIYLFMFIYNLYILSLYHRYISWVLNMYILWIYIYIYIYIYIRVPGWRKKQEKERTHWINPYYNSTHKLSQLWTQILFIFTKVLSRYSVFRFCSWKIIESKIRFLLNAWFAHITENQWFNITFPRVNTT